MRIYTRVKLYYAVNERWLRNYWNEKATHIDEFTSLRLRMYHRMQVSGCFAWINYFHSEIKWIFFFFFFKLFSSKTKQTNRLTGHESCKCTRRMKNQHAQTSSDEENRRSGAKSWYLLIACRGLSKTLVDRLTSISDGVEKPRIEFCKMFTPRNDADFRSIFVRHSQCTALLISKWIMRFIDFRVTVPICFSYAEFTI